MNKTLIGITMVSVLAGVFIFTGTASAMAPAWDVDSASLGRGPGNGFATDEPLYLNHDDNVAALVELTGLDEAEIIARIDAGETAYDIAIAAGVSEEDFYALLPMGTYGFGMMGDGSYGRFGEAAPRYMLQVNAQYFYQEGDCDADGVPDQLYLQDGTGVALGGRWNR
ncbi:MAG: hypothetical protein JXA97_11160 [Anaerolineales bacterium]|nr:hypothetical protein [Anaerolineales bacterium]